MQRPIYLDHGTTTPLLPGVFDSMTPWLTDQFGDPASGGHAYGWEAERGLESARAQVADLLGAAPAEIVFTSSGTEALGLAVRGVAEILGGQRRHLVVSATARDVLRAQVEWLTARGFEADWIAPGPDGRVAADEVLAAVRPAETLLVCLESVNGELCVAQPIADVAPPLAELGVLLLVDATFGAGVQPLSVEAGPLPLVALSAHRMGGPKGAGALYVRRRQPRVRLMPQFGGSARERARRGGMPDLPALVGFGAAATWWRAQGEDARRTLAARLDALLDHLQRAGGFELLGAGGARPPHLLAGAFEGIEGESLVTALTRVAFATGSSCVTGHGGRSQVLDALGRDDLQARLLRFGVGPATTEAQIEEAGTMIADAVARLRAM